MVTFSNNLRFELIGDGEQSGIWGTTTNGNLGTLVEQAVTGVQTLTHPDTPDFVLTALNGAVDQARNAALIIDGTLTADRNVVVPAVDKVYIVRNDTTGGFAITVKTQAGTGVEIENGDVAIIFCDATNVQPVTSSVQPGSIGTDELADNAVTNAKILNNAIDGNHIVSGAVTEVKIATFAVETDKIANNAVTTNSFPDGGVKTEDIVDGAVGSNELADQSITVQKIAANAVGTTEIQTNAVGLSEISTAAQEALRSLTVYAGTDANNLVYPVATVVPAVVAFDNQFTDNNATFLVSITGGGISPEAFVDGTLPNTDLCAGTWRARGFLGNVNVGGQFFVIYRLFQRVA